MSSLPLMCARLRSELGLVEPQTKALIDKACEEIGVERAGSLVERARGPGTPSPRRPPSKLTGRCTRRL